MFKKEKTMNIIPKPQTLLLKNTFSSIGANFSLNNNFEDNRNTFIENFLRSEIDKFGLKQTDSDFSIIIDKNDLESESYTLEIHDDKCHINATDYNGIFYAILTFLQILESSDIENGKITINNLEINDQPRFTYRGMHLDVSRHFFHKSFIKRYIDLLAMHKFNTFHWHLTDDNGWRLEIKQYPKLTEIGAWRVDHEDEPWRTRRPAQPGEKSTYGGFYTQEDVKEIIDYAHKRGIEIIPEIEMPGHTLEVLAAYPELACFPQEFHVATGSYWPNKDILCAGKDEVFVFFENVLDEVIELFPSKYIHIGGDEAEKSNWKICPNCQKRIKDENLKDEFELQSWFIRRIEKYLISKDKILIGWDEILEGGLAPQAVVMSWRGVDGGIEAAKKGHDVIMTPGTHCYFDHYQSDPTSEPEAIGGYTPVKHVYTFDPIPPELTEEEAKHVLGGQGNVWTEWIETDEHCEYMILPRMSALAETVWTNKELLNWDDFRIRLNKHMKKLSEAGYNVCKGSSRVMFVSDFNNNYNSFLLDTELSNPEIRYCIDAEVTENSNLYKNDVIQIDEEVQIHAAIYMDGTKFGNDSILNLIPNKSSDHDFDMLTEPSDRYPGFGNTIFKSAFRAKKNIKSKFWLGFQSDVNFALTPNYNFTKMQFVFLHSPHSIVYLPDKIEINNLTDNTSEIFEMDRIKSETEIRIPEIEMQFQKDKEYKIELKFRGKIDNGTENGILSWIFLNQILCK
jgi:hexosaminidase